MPHSRMNGLPKFGGRELGGGRDAKVSAEMLVGSLFSFLGGLLIIRSGYPGRVAIAARRLFWDARPALCHKVSRALYGG